MILVAVSKRVFGTSHAQLHAFGVQQASLLQGGLQFREAVLGYESLGPEAADRSKKDSKKLEVDEHQELDSQAPATERGPH